MKIFWKEKTRPELSDLALDIIKTSMRARMEEAARKIMAAREACKVPRNLEMG